MDIQVVIHRSNLKFDENGVLPLRLFQLDDNPNLIGNRMSFVDAQRTTNATQVDIDAYEKLLNQTESAALNVISFHPGVGQSQQRIRELSADRTIVAHRGLEEKNNKLVTILGHAEGTVTQDKLSLSSEDIRSDIKRGNAIHLFLPDEDSPNRAVKWAVLNCHDYTDVNLVQLLMDYEIEVVVVTAYNPAARLFREYAISDSHRMFCYLVNVNTGSIGGSGVYAPFRSLGKNKNASFSAGAELFGSRGPGEFITDINLDIRKLREFKSDFSKNGFDSNTFNPAKQDYFSAVAPSERYLDTGRKDPNFGKIPNIIDIPISSLSDKYKVAILQMQPMSSDTYLDYKYRFPEGKEKDQFCDEIRAELESLLVKCQRKSRGKDEPLIDMVVLPEVFVPRDFANGFLTEFAQKVGCTVVAGLDYPGTQEVENANECIIIRPGEATSFYRKVTRSQYDAVAKQPKNATSKFPLPRMTMNRGTDILRFITEDGNGYGILICYDFSHLELMNRINLENRNAPLDFVVVVANNPFAQLYRSCCIADSHRFYQFIVMCNVAQFGGSGVFGPASGSGARQTFGELGKGAVGSIIHELDLEMLQSYRELDDKQINQIADKPIKGDRFMRRPGIFQNMRRNFVKKIN